MVIRIINDQNLINEESLNNVSEYINKLSDVICDADYTDIKLLHALRNSYANLTYVDKSEIQELNKENRDIDAPTDVLSFPMLYMSNGKLDDELSPVDFEMDADGNKLLPIGDIIICPEVAKENADKYGHSFDREVSFLVAHSLLHLFGFDHVEEKDEKLMIRKQKELMVKIGLAFDDEEAEITNHKEDSLMDNIAYPAGSECDHCGYVALLGRPNVGKSTLINYITGMKVAIVSHKPQTTRTNIRSIYNTDNSQVIFVDTPGVHRPDSKLSEIMVSNSFKAVKNADAVVLLADGRFKTPGKVEQQLIEACKEGKKKVILAISKSDDVSKESLLPIIASYSALIILRR